MYEANLVILSILVFLRTLVFRIVTVFWPCMAEGVVAALMWWCHMTWSSR